MPITVPFRNIMDFGARPNDDRAAAKAANSAAFEQAQDAMNNAPEAFGHLLFVPSGRFYLAKELRIWKSLELFGTGIQQAPCANANRIAVEQDELVGQRGKYLHPEVYGQPFDMGLESIWRLATRVEAAPAADQPLDRKELP